MWETLACHEYAEELDFRIKNPSMSFVSLGTRGMILNIFDLRMCFKEVEKSDYTSRQSVVYASWLNCFQYFCMLEQLNAFATRIKWWLIYWTISFGT